ncbi:thiolase family protein [Streptomyces sp. NPDC004237]|uniref:thiolase family protein n=1 Tax=Streptomyces sp. NPDC004237 TaxID=3154455 RepID=UPI0033BC5EE6
MLDVFIIDAVRTPIGRAGKGALVGVRPDDLAALAVRALVERTGIPGEAIDDHQLGCGYPEREQGYNLARRVGLLAGLPVSVPGATVSRFCASSLQAARAAFHAIRSGESDIQLVSGVESISRVGRTLRPEDRHPDLCGDRLPDVYVPMGITAENVAGRYGIDRADMDALALRSHQRAVAAREAGILDREIVPVDGVVYADEGPRPDTSAAALAALRPAFTQDGSVTAGNSCPLSDGAAAVLLAGEAAVRRFGLRPRARILATAVSAVTPEMMGVGPIDAIRRVLAATGMTVDDVDVVELNEAFAAQVIAVCREVGIDMDWQLNPYGGAIALGHPFGMTGARLVGAALNDLEVRDGEIGLATLCVGGGQGMAALLQRL